MDTLEAIRNLRSIRKYRADSADDKTLEVVLEAARLAPSGLLFIIGDSSSPLMAV